MSAEVLRAAARLMRTNANAATPGPWTVPGVDDEYVGRWDVVGDGEPGDRYIICEHAGMDAPHIASWHPAAALAVAKAMDDVALAWEICDDGWTRDMDDDAIRFEDTVDGGWLNVARAYLGAES